MWVGMSFQTAFARLIFVLAGASGIIGIAAGFAEEPFRLGAATWLILCAAGMAASIAILLDEYVRGRKASP